MSVELSFFLFLLALMVAMLGPTSSSIRTPMSDSGAPYQGPWNRITRSSELPQAALIAADAIESPPVAAAGMQ